MEKVPGRHDLQKPFTSLSQLPAAPVFEDSTQGAEPIVVFVVPEVHAVHTPESAPVYPASQRQRSNGKPSRGDDEYEGHVVHVSDPGRLLYVPARHDAQLLRTGRFKSRMSILFMFAGTMYTVPDTLTPPLYFKIAVFSSSMNSNIGVGNNVRTPI
jgi:hypothetical protein